MSSDSETSAVVEAELRKAVTHLDQVIQAIKALGHRNGSSRDEIVDFLVSRDLMEPRIAKALVAKALYKGLDQGLIKRPRGSHRYQASSGSGGSSSRRRKRPHRERRKRSHEERKRTSHRSDRRRHKCHR